MRSVSLETVVADLQRPSLEVEYLQNDRERVVWSNSENKEALNKYTESSYGQYNLQFKH